jgi:hypothetical protein
MAILNHSLRSYFNLLYECETQKMTFWSPGHLVTKLLVSLSDAFRDRPPGLRKCPWDADTLQPLTLLTHTVFNAVTSIGVRLILPRLSYERLGWTQAVEMMVAGHGVEPTARLAGVRCRSKQVQQHSLTQIARPWIRGKSARENRWEDSSSAVAFVRENDLGDIGGTL